MLEMEKKHADYIAEDFSAIIVDGKIYYHYRSVKRAKKQLKEKDNGWVEPWSQRDWNGYKLHTPNVLCKNAKNIHRIDYYMEERGSWHGNPMGNAIV